jgi:hypothetical protein
MHAARAPFIETVARMSVLLPFGSARMKAEVDDFDNPGMEAIGLRAAA